MLTVLRIILIVVIVSSITTAGIAFGLQDGEIQSSIVFQSDRDGNDEIYIMNGDGSEAKRLTNNSAADEAPVISPDGSKIAFQSRRDGNLEIYVVSANGGDEVNLTNYGAHDELPDWSPDGTKIAFNSARGSAGNNEIYVMDADGSNLIRLTEDPSIDEEAVWSPDGSKIAFMSDRSGNREVYVIGADGSGLTKLTDGPGRSVYPDWSPDGNNIAFMTDRDGNWEIYIMNSDGSNQTNLTNNPSHDQFPAWSSDGSKIVFDSNRDGNREIYVMDRNGSRQINISNNPALDQLPDWGLQVKASPPPTSTPGPDPTATPTTTPPPTQAPSPSDQLRDLIVEGIRGAGEVNLDGDQYAPHFLIAKDLDTFQISEWASTTPAEREENCGSVEALCPQNGTVHKQVRRFTDGVIRVKWELYQDGWLSVLNITNYEVIDEERTHLGQGWWIFGSWEPIITNDDLISGRLSLSGTSRLGGVGFNLPIKATIVNTSSRSWLFGVQASVRQPDGTERDLGLKTMDVASGDTSDQPLVWGLEPDWQGFWDLRVVLYKESAHPLDTPLHDSGWLEDYIDIRLVSPPATEPPEGISEPVHDDHGSSWSSATEIALFDMVNGQIEGQGDVDYFAIELQQGITYKVETSLGSLQDSILFLYASDGLSEITRNDDSVGTLASRIQWTAKASEKYFVRVAPFSNMHIGSYVLSVEPVELTPSTGGQSLTTWVSEGDVIDFGIYRVGFPPVPWTDFAFGVDPYIYFNACRNADLSSPCKLTPADSHPTWPNKLGMGSVGLGERIIFQGSLEISLLETSDEQVLVQLATIDISSWNVIDSFPSSFKLGGGNRTLHPANISDLTIDWDRVSESDANLTIAMKPGFKAISRTWTILVAYEDAEYSLVERRYQQKVNGQWQNIPEETWWDAAVGVTQIEVLSYFLKYLTIPLDYFNATGDLNHRDTQLSHPEVFVNDNKFDVHIVTVPLDPFPSPFEQEVRVVLGLSSTESFETPLFISLADDFEPLNRVSWEEVFWLEP